MNPGDQPAMRKGFLILVWVLLLLPTLGIGGAALYLLRHEQERIHAAAAAAWTTRAASVAADLDLAVTGTCDSVLRQLAAVPEADLAAGLQAWRGASPLVRNVFVWQPPNRLRLPDPERPATAEEGQFVRRYEGLFSGRVAWGGTPTDAPPEAGPAPAPMSSLRSLGRLASQSLPATPAGGSSARQGWLAWFWENRLFLLGWCQPRPDAPVRGVELETMALLSHLLTALPTDPTGDHVFALLDGSGQVVHQTGALEIGPRRTPLARLPVGPALPHWQVAVYAATAGPEARATERAFGILSALVVGAFVAAILTGGLLLMRQAQQSHREARQRTSFVSHVSHELKTPLTSIRMYAELLRDRPPADADKARRYLDTIVAEGERLTRLVNNVLDFSRLEQGRRSYHATDLDMAAAVRDVLDRQDGRLAQAGLRLHAELPAAPVVVRFDHDVLEQVLLNLLDNAAKYAGGGGEVEVCLTDAGPGTVLRVLDRGPGVPAAERERVFERFYRVDSSLTAQQPGFGLGLSIARRLVRDLGGDLVCEGRDGGGAAFVLTVPRQRE